MEKIDTPYPLLKSKEYAVEEKLKPRRFVQACKETSPSGLSPAEQEVLKKDLFHIKLPFPWKLHELLDHVERDSKEHIISWLPCGRAFQIHKPDEFCDSIMTKYFRQTQFKSFTRQVGSNVAMKTKHLVRFVTSSFVVSHLLQKLYIYGFSKIIGGDADRTRTFSHPEFVKGNRSPCLTLGRNRFGDRRLKKSRKRTPTPPLTEEFERPRNACMSSIQVLGRSNEAAGSLKAESRNYPFAVGSALFAAQERLVEIGRATPTNASSNLVVGIGRATPTNASSNLVAGIFDPAGIIDVSLRKPYVARSAHALGNRTTLPDETSSSDWVTVLEKKFLFQNAGLSCPSLGVMSTDMSIWDDLEPRPIEKMNVDAWSYNLRTM
jgi:hypothetical protein